MTSPHRLRLVALLFVMLVSSGIATLDAHRSGCHRRHACSSDHGTCACGDLGYCSQCPDHEYCQGGKPRPAAGQQVLPPPQLPKADVMTTPVLTIVDGDIIDVRLDERKVRVRYIGINTPETSHPTKGVEPFGKEAKEATGDW
jgi:endonuclease YncB( thermonuclease family)